VRFFVRGFYEVEGMDYEETFAHVAQYTSIRTIISLATSIGWRLQQMDVKTTFLNGGIEEEAYNKQLDGFVLHERDSHVCRLNKALYGLKHEPQCWNARIDGHLMSSGFRKSVSDPNLYYKTVNGESMILVLYVDDLFLTGTKRLIVE
jgi:hypothetical protein